MYQTGGEQLPAGAHVFSALAFTHLSSPVREKGARRRERIRDAEPLLLPTA